MPIHHTPSGNFWDRLSNLTIGLLLILVFAGIAIWFFPVLKHKENLLKMKYKMQKTLKAEMDHSVELDEHIKALKEDKLTVEREARATLGYVKQGEYLIRFDVSENSP